jgi:hypothetical protein
MAEHTALEFTYIEFDGDWARAPWGNWVSYQANADGEVVVVAEGETGTKTTYWYKIPLGEEVWVSFSENLAYLPRRCVRRDEGDHTRCEEA